MAYRGGRRATRCVRTAFAAYSTPPTARAPSSPHPPQRPATTDLLSERQGTGSTDSTRALATSSRISLFRRCTHLRSSMCRWLLLLRLAWASRLSHRRPRWEGPRHPRGAARPGEPLPRAEDGKSRKPPAHPHNRWRIKTLGPVEPSWKNAPAVRPHLVDDPREVRALAGRSGQDDCRHSQVRRPCELLLQRLLALHTHPLVGRAGVNPLGDLTHKTRRVFTN